MKAKRLLTILIIASVAITGLCCFSYGLSDDAQYGISFEQYFTLYGKASDFNSTEKSFVVDSEKSTHVRIPGDYKIIIDGRLGSFESIEMLSEYKNITVSYPGNNSKIIFIQTIPHVFTGLIRSIDSNEDYYITADVNSLEMIFYIEKGTLTDDIQTGDVIHFIPDGSRIIEVVKE